MMIIMRLILVALSVLPCQSMAVAGEAKPQKQASQHFCGDFRIKDNARAIINIVLESDAAMFRCERSRRYCFGEQISWLHAESDIMHLVPHRFGWVDMLNISAAVLDERPDWQQAISDAAFGPVGIYTMTLWDFPRNATLKNLQLLSQLPNYDNLSVLIVTDHPDKQIREAAKQMRVRCCFVERDLSGLATNGGRVAGTVVDSRQKPVEGATIVVRGRDGKPISHTNSTDKQGRFAIDNMPQVPYRICACRPSPWDVSAGVPVAFSEEVKAVSGDGKLCIVLNTGK